MPLTSVAQDSFLVGRLFAQLLAADALATTTSFDLRANHMMACVFPDQDVIAHLALYIPSANLSPELQEA